mgnify:CR=1 FL=1
MLKNPPKDLQIDPENLTGFWRGVVEDNKDPLKAGRVRIRIHGLHTPKTVKNELEGIPTNELPWAEPCMPIHEGSVSGFGVWSVPLQGSQVMVFFENKNPSQPRYFASMPGIPESKDQYLNNSRTTNKTDGFKDPDGKYPSKERLGEPDFHRLARGRKERTLVVTKNQERDIAVPTALGGNWSEPQSPYNTKYPHNHVIATHGGITIELDSTPGSTRLHLYHPSNSFIEIDNSGNMVVKNNAEKYEIVTSGKNVHIKQQRNITIDADSKKRIGDNELIEVGGNKQEDVGGNKQEDVSGNMTENIGGELTITVDGNASVTAPIITLNGLTNINGIITAVGSGGVGGSMSGTFTINGGDIIADGISLKEHTHSQDADSDGDAQVETNPPS